MKRIINGIAVFAMAAAATAATDASAVIVNGNVVNAIQSCQGTFTNSQTGKSTTCTITGSWTNAGGGQCTLYYSCSFSTGGVNMTTNGYTTNPAASPQACQNMANDFCSGTIPPGSSLNDLFNAIGVKI